MKKAYKNSEKLEYLSQLSKSGETKVEFCRRTGISGSTLHRWQKDASLGLLSESLATETKPRPFIEVKDETSKSITIEYQGVKFILSGSWSSNEVVSISKGLIEQC